MPELHATGVITDVPRLGSVILSYKAMTSLERDGITGAELSEVLRLGTDTKDYSVPHGGHREHNGIRLILRTHPGLEGSPAVCIDAYRVTE